MKKNYTLLIALCISCLGYTQPANDECINATVISTFPFNTNQNTTGVINNNGGITCTSGDYIADGVWFTYTAATNEDVAIIAMPTSAWDLSLGLFSNCTPTCLEIQNVNGNGQPETITYSFVQGNTYYINVAGFPTEIPESTQPCYPNGNPPCIPCDVARCIIMGTGGSGGSNSFDLNITSLPTPEIICLDDITVSTDSGICGATVNYSTPTITGNAGVIGISGLASGSEFPVGSTTITFDIENFNTGAMQSCDMTVTVEDNEPPNIVVNGSVGYSDGSFSVSISSYDISYSDNCDTPSATLVFNSYSCEDDGGYEYESYTYDYTVTDTSGNSNSILVYFDYHPQYEANIQCNNNLNEITIELGIDGTYSFDNDNSPLQPCSFVYWCSTYYGDLTTIPSTLDCNMLGTNDNILLADRNSLFTGAPLYYITVIVTDPNGYCNTASVNEFDTSKISLFPNPTTDKVTITNAEQLIIQNVSIFNINGAKVMEQQGDMPSIDVSDLQTGLYFMTIKTDEGNVTKKVVKQ